MLKRQSRRPKTRRQRPAAFRRLCVETQEAHQGRLGLRHPAAFRRLCVETWAIRCIRVIKIPAAFRRLCVETKDTIDVTLLRNSQPPSGGCVLKL